MAYVRQHPEFPMFRIKKGSMPDFSGSAEASQEIPEGEMDGSNKEFMTAHRPLKYTEKLSKDGMFMARATTASVVDGDYYLDYDTNKITFSDNQVPQANSIIRITYKYMKLSD